MSAPEYDEIEITLFGRGVGECLAIHYGNNEWMVIDSFRDPSTNEPIAAKYLESIGVGLENVRYIVATHADADHIRGIGKLYESCLNATVIIPNALRDPNFITLAQGSFASDYSTLIEREEFAQVFSEMNRRRQQNLQGPIFHLAAPNMVIFDETVGISGSAVSRELRSFSPSDEASLSARDEITAVVRELMERGARKPVGKIPKLKNNHTSIVLWLKVGQRVFLFGGDLECLDNPRDGWLHVLNLPGRPDDPAEFYKVSHHGAPNGHNDQVWDTMIANDNTCGITSYAAGRTSRPQPEDLQKISDFTANAYLAGTTRQLRARYDRKVDTILRKIGKNVIRVDHSLGRITYRTKITNGPTDWDITVHGAAFKL